MAQPIAIPGFLDPAPVAPLPPESFGLVDVIKPDAKEAQAITGIEVQDRDTARQAAKHLLQRGVKVVTIQAGSQGNLLIWQEGDCFFLPPAYSSALYQGLFQGVRRSHALTQREDRLPP